MTYPIYSGYTTKVWHIPVWHILFTHNCDTQFSGYTTRCTLYDISYLRTNVTLSSLNTLQGVPRMTYPIYAQLWHSVLWICYKVFPVSHILFMHNCDTQFFEYTLQGVPRITYCTCTYAQLWHSVLWTYYKVSLVWHIVLTHNCDTQFSGYATRCPPYDDCSGTFDRVVAQLRENESISRCCSTTVRSCPFILRCWMTVGCAGQDVSLCIAFILCHIYHGISDSGAI